jgi:hypothetical protein
MRTLAQPDRRAEILDRLRGVRPESAARWGRMSAHEMICHLADGCRMATGRKPVSAAPTGWVPRRLVKWTALYLPLRWPAGIATRPETDQHCDGTRPADFAADVRALERLLHEIADHPDALDRPHPVFGRMSRAAWLRWAYLHADHHLRQFGA